MAQYKGFGISFEKEIFTMVEENLEFWYSDMAQYKGFGISFEREIFAMVEENFEFWSPVMAKRIFDQEYFMSKILTLRIQLSISCA